MQMNIVMSLQVILKSLAMFSSRFISGNDVISLESRPLNFRVIIHAFSFNQFSYNLFLTFVKPAGIM